MRGLLLILPAVLMAQTPPAKSPAAPPKAASSTAPTRSGVAKRPATSTTLMTDDEKTIYAIGLSMYRQLSQFDLSPAELELIKKALSDAAGGKPAVDVDAWSAKIEPLGRARASRAQNAALSKAAAPPRLSRAKRIRAETSPVKHRPLRKRCAQAARERAR